MQTSYTACAVILMQLVLDILAEVVKTLNS